MKILKHVQKHGGNSHLEIYCNALYLLHAFVNLASLKTHTDVKQSQRFLSVQDALKYVISKCEYAIDIISDANNCLEYIL